MLFQKFKNRKKNTKESDVLGWGWPIFPNFEKTKEPDVKAVNAGQFWLSIETGRSRDEKEREISSFEETFSFRWPYRNMYRRDIFFPYYYFVNEDNFCRLGLACVIEMIDFCISNFYLKCDSVA